MRAIRYHEFGDASVLREEDAPVPEPGGGTIRIAVKAAGVNPLDWKMRRGYLAEMIPPAFPTVPGTDAAGVVEALGEGVADVTVGDEVFGLGAATSAEYAVLDLWSPKPPDLSFVDAAALGLAVETAGRTLDRMGLPAGATLLVDGAAGGVGSALVQLALARDLAVIGSAGPGNQEYVASLGASPTTYGDGLADRVRLLAPSGVDGAVDVVGLGSVPTLVAITGAPDRVATVADFSQYGTGVHVIDTSAGRAGWALAEAAQLFQAGRFTVPIQAYPMAELAAAHRQSEEMHVRGKLVITVP
jgi:NADPH:quinone reductase-like Zn-dependent oxidoreductase